MDGISKALNTEFEMDVVPVPTKKEIAPIIDTGRLVIDDKEYMRLELMEAISSLQTMKTLIEEDLARPPRKASDVEAYTMVISQIKECVRELRQLGGDSSSLELNQRKLDKQVAAAMGGQIGTQINNTFFLDSKELSKMISDAKANNSLKEIDATFDVDKQIK